MTQKFKAAIFDLDGTLLDTLDDLADAMNRTLSKMGFPEHPAEAYKMFVGNGADVLTQRALPENARDRDTVMKTLKAFAEDYKQNWDVKTQIYQGVTEALEHIASENICLNVLSNKPDIYMQAIRSRFFPNAPFKCFRGQVEGIPKKPDPQGALAIASEIGISPDEIIYIGDSSIDMDTANNAEMASCGVLWGFRSREELMKHGAKFLATAPEDLPGIICT